jgi:hypothetical protein
MSVQLYAFTCGPVTGDFAHLMEGGEGGIRVPIPVALIEHQKGRAWFDTGLHLDCRHDPKGCLGARIAPLFRIGFDPGEEVSARLEAIGRECGGKKVVCLTAPHCLLKSKDALVTSTHQPIEHLPQQDAHPFGDVRFSKEALEVEARQVSDFGDSIGLPPAEYGLSRRR